MSFYPVAGPLSTNARDPGTTIRNPSTALLGIDSEDRFTDFVAARASTTSSPFDFTITKPENIMAGFFTRVGVTEVAFPWVIPNVNEKSNRIICNFVALGVPGQALITLDVGFYTPRDLALAIQGSVLDAVAIPAMAASGFAMDYGLSMFEGFASYPNASESAFKYTCVTPGYTIAFAPLNYNVSTYPYPATTKQLFDVLGFTTANTVQASTASGSITFCQWTRYVDITCQQLTLNQSLKDAASQPVVHDMLARLYVSAAPGQSSTGSPVILYSQLSPPVVQPVPPVVPPLEPVPVNPYLNLPYQASAAIGSPCFPGNAATTIYKDYAHPKQIQWLPNQNVPGYLRFIVYDDSGAPLQEALGPTSPPSVNWSMTIQFSEN